MKRIDTYEELDGGELVLSGLDAEERRLVARLRRRARSHPDWDAFDNYAYAAVREFYAARGVPRKRVVDTVPFKVVQDLSSRLGIAAGLIREPEDYREELEDLMLTKFPTRRAFCTAAGLSEDMLSHVLAGRKDLSLGALTKALERIGYRLRIAPGPERHRTG